MISFQGGLAHALQYTAKDVNDTTIGISALVRRLSLPEHQAVSVK